MQSWFSSCGKFLNLGKHSKTVLLFPPPPQQGSTFCTHTPPRILQHMRSRPSGHCLPCSCPFLDLCTLPQHTPTQEAPNLKLNLFTRRQVLRQSAALLKKTGSGSEDNVLRQPRMEGTHGCFAEVKDTNTAFPVPPDSPLMQYFPEASSLPNNWSQTRHTHAPQQQRKNTAFCFVFRKISFV